MEVGLFRLGAFRMAGHGDVAEGALLLQRGAQFAAVQQPALELGRRFAARGAGFQQVEQRGDLRKVPEVNLFRDKNAGAVRSQFVKRQQIHFSMSWIFTAGGGRVQQIQVKSLNPQECLKRTISEEWRLTQFHRRNAGFARSAMLYSRHT